MEKTSKEELERMAKVAYPDSDYASNAVFVENNRIAWSKGFRAAESMPSDAVDKIIQYIENDSECAIPIEKMFKDGQHITKKEYGLILLETLCAELREKFKSIKQEG